MKNELKQRSTRRRRSGQLTMVASQHPDLIDGANPANGCTAVHVAAGNGHANAIESLVRLGARPRPIRNNSHALRRIEQARGCDRHAGSTALDQTDKHGWTMQQRMGTRKCSRRWCDSAARRSTSPKRAGLRSRERQTDVIETLIRLGSTALDRPDEEGRTAIEVAVLSGSPMQQSC